MSAKLPPVPDLEELSVKFTEENFLELSWQINQPKVQRAMETAVAAYSDYFKAVWEKELKDLKRLRDASNRPQ